MKKLISTLLAVGFVVTSSIITMAGIKPNNYYTLPEEYRTALDQVDDTYTMYATTAIHVRDMAFTTASLYKTITRNTPVDCLMEKDGWTMILGEDDNYHFIKSDYLSNTETNINYTEDDLYCLSHIINAEMGCESWEDKIYTGSVVLNRVNGDPWWSSGKRTIRAVVFRTHPLQYAPIKNGTFYNTPSAESVRAAIYLLENGSQIPSNVVFQAEFRQGKGIWKRTKGAFYCYQ